MNLRSVRLVLTTLAIAFAFATAHAKTPLILSTDVGNEIDDQWAIAYMMANPHFEVLGLTSAHSPSLPFPAGYESYLLLKDEIENRMGMRVHPPILRGSDAPLKDRRTAQDNDAVRFLIEQSKPFNSNNRLTIVVIGAATDVASAVLIDPSIADRIRIVAMAFKTETDGVEYNVQNDVPAWQILLDSNVPVVLGDKQVCFTDLPMYYDQAKTMLASNGAVGAWLWGTWNKWYYREVKPLRKADFSKPRAIWDMITLAYLEGFATSETKPRPSMADDMKLTIAPGQRTVTWITHVEAAKLWEDFQKRMAIYEQTHAIATASSLGSTF
jgi:inosine-uridine nucleoside N-ribohydrolase